MIDLLMATMTKCVNGHEMPTDKHSHACPQCGAGHEAFAVEPFREMFPHAGVPGASDFNQVLQVWKEKWGLEPHDVARADTLQSIDIVHDPLDGKLTWNKRGPMDGLMTIWLAVSAAISIGEYFSNGAGRIDMPSGEAAVGIVYKDGRLSFDSQPKGNQLALEELLTSLLRYFWAKQNGNPVERFLQAFGWES